MKTPYACIPLPILLFVLGAMLAVSSCNQKELSFIGEDVRVRVVFDWQDALHADPEGMTLLFFPADSQSMSWRFDIPKRGGGEIELLSGIYNIVAFNSDLPGVEFLNTDSFRLISANARNYAGSLTSPTGMLYSAIMTDVPVFPSEPYSRMIRLKPDSLSTVYRICLDSVSGTHRIKTATAVLKGTARSVCLSLQKNSADTCCMASTLRIAPDNPERLETVASGFGRPDIPDPRFQLEVTVTTSHGRYSKTFDVTDQVMNCKYPKNVDIYIKGLVIPEADTPTNPDGTHDVGISVGVDGWQLIEIIYS
ncbi:MAG: DUF5119 domain-containing protein [Muribaculaceae bacterium]|nr:DUF5119 domain-containing protein [Muribaculaceae bacterium]